MIIHQAFFGERNGSHNLLVTSIEDKQLIGHLKTITDKPASINVDYPYLSGSKIANYYVFIQTLNDPTATRPGMIFSHCLIIPLKLVAEIQNANSLFAYFEAISQKQTTSLVDIAIDNQQPLDTVKPDVYMAVLNTLMQNDKTVIFLGYDDFVATIAHLWHNFPRQLRTNLSFTISGTPNEIKGENYTLVHTPIGYENKWSAYPLVKKGDTITVKPTLSLALLSGEDAELLPDFRQFIAENDFTFTRPNELVGIEMCFNLIKEAKTTPTIILLKRIINRLSKLLPEPKQGEQLKADVFSQFLNCLSIADMAGFKALANMSFSAFEQGQERIETHVQWWASANISASSRLSDEDIAKLANTAYSGSEPDWWKMPIEQNMEHLCGNINEKNAELLWHVWVKDTSLINRTSVLINNDNAENAFLATIPKHLANNVLQETAAFTANKHWYSLHAIAIVQYLPPNKAIQTQINKDSSSKLEHNLWLMRERMSKSDFLNAAIAINNKPLHRLAGEICATEAAFLAKLDVANLNWQFIWQQTFLLTNIRHGINDLRQTLYQLLDLKISGQTVIEELLSAIAPQINHLWEYDKRSKVWGVLKYPLKDTFLQSTAKYAFEHSDTITLSELEPELKQELQRGSFIETQVLITKQVSVMAKLKYLVQLSVLTEGYLITILKSDYRRLNHFEADYIADFIRNKRWHNALDFAYQKSDENDFLHHIASKCRDMLSWLQKKFIEKRYRHIDIKDLEKEIDEGHLSGVFTLLADLGVNTSEFNKLKNEYVGGGLKGSELNELGGRLKVLLNELKNK